MHKDVLLTFDDGPHELVTPAILELLDSVGVKAIFFVLGKKLEMESQREIVRQAVARGHAIGNHGYSHAFEDQPWEEFKDELRRTDELIDAIIGRRSMDERYYRLPYGYCENDQRGPALQLMKIQSFGWTINSSDWLYHTSDSEIAHEMGTLISERVMASVRASKQESEVILLHDGGPSIDKNERWPTLYALREILRQGEEENLEYLVMSKYMEKYSQQELLKEFRHSVV